MSMSKYIKSIKNRVQLWFAEEPRNISIYLSILSIFISIFLFMYKYIKSNKNIVQVWFANEHRNIISIYMSIYLSNCLSSYEKFRIRLTNEARKAL